MLHLESINNVFDNMESFLQLIGVLLIFVFVLALTYLTTRWMAGYQKGRGNNRNLRVIESMGIGNGNLLSIVQAGDKYLLVAVGKDKVTMLVQLDKEEIKDVPQESFQNILSRFKDK